MAWMRTYSRYILLKNKMGYDFFEIRTPFGFWGMGFYPPSIYNNKSHFAFSVFCMHGHVQVQLKVYCLTTDWPRSFIDVRVMHLKSDYSPTPCADVYLTFTREEREPFGYD
jgi:hypothetical protein